MTEIELKLENNALKIEVLNLRTQHAQAALVLMQQEREKLIEEYKAEEAKRRDAAQHAHLQVVHDAAE